MRYPLLFLLFLIAYPSRSQQLTIDAQRSSIKFYVRNFGLEVEGVLDDVKGSVTFDERNLETSSFLLSVDVATIDTGIALRNKHLQKDDYFDTKNYKTIEFTSTRIISSKKTDEIVVSGNLKIRNTTRQIDIPVKVTSSGKIKDFSGSFMINRLDYMVGKSSVSLSDEVRVVFSIRMDR